MKDETAIFGVKSDRLDKLVFNALDQSEHEEDLAPTFALDAILERSGGQIGRYKLLAVLGEGGMGMVHLAEQQYPIKRQVALKVIKPGMDSKRIIARFEAERQVLALLDHPSIAHVYDAGTTTTGRPYFAMEYVEGLPITVHCDQNRLTVEERLRLFLDVCHAVHHAHQKGILHRDIKPSNILVTTVDGRAVPKIIDFGIARAVSKPLADKTLFVEQNRLVGTPEYMSPEQADSPGAADTDIRSDIYSLGVVLYQLLTGVLPFDSDSFREHEADHIRKAIRNCGLEKPSIRLKSMGQDAEFVAEKRQTTRLSLIRTLHRELEWIPLKALQKDRVRRYRFAAELADDIENYLRGTPLIAGPGSIAYRAKKFIRRHCAAALAVGLLAVILMSATLISTVSYVLAARAREIAEKRTEAYRRLLYVNQIALAHTAYREADLDRTRELLTRCADDLREFAWSYLWRLCQVVPQTPTIRHEQPVNAMAFSPTSDMLATASGDTIRLWNASTRHLQVELEGHTDIVESLAFSPDGAMLASSGGNRPAVLWDVNSRRDISELILDEPTQTIASSSLTFSPSGKTIAVECWTRQQDETGQVLILWDVDSGKYELLPLSQRIDNRIFGMAFSPDSKLLAAAGVQRTTVWDVGTHRKIATLRGHGTHVNKVVFLPDGHTIATTGNDGTVAFWEVAAKKQLASINAHHAPVLSMALSPDGKVLATGSADSTIKLWNTVDKQQVAEFKGHNSEVRCLAFSSNGTFLASASKDCTTKIWELGSRSDSDTLFGHNRIVHGVAFFPDNRRLISTAYGIPAVKMWDISSGRDLSSALGDPPIKFALGLDLSPDGKILAIGTDDLVLWDMAAKEVVDIFPHPNNNVNEAVFSPDGKLLATQTFEPEFKLWDMETGAELRSLEGYGSHYGAIAFSPDGRKLAIPRNADRTLTLWDTSDICGDRVKIPEAILAGHTEQVNAVAFSHDSTILASGSDDTTIILWNPGKERKIVTLTGHTSNVHCLAFSPDGKTLASGGNDGTVRLWNLMLNEQVAVLEGHDSAIWEIAFSPDGYTLASSSFDGTVKLWRAAPDNDIPAQNYTNE